MTTAEVCLDAQVLLQQIHALGAIGHDTAHGGRTRIALTDAEKAGRDQLVRWMGELGLEVCVDRIGNIFGVLPATDAEGNARPLMMGGRQSRPTGTAWVKDHGCTSVQPLEVTRQCQVPGGRGARSCQLASTPSS